METQKKLFKVTLTDLRYVFYVIAYDFSDAEKKLLLRLEENKKADKVPNLSFVLIHSIELIVFDDYVVQ
jgi:hypothetical protein